MNERGLNAPFLFTFAAHFQILILKVVAEVISGNGIKICINRNFFIG
jgi:hypothetical protein